MTYENVLPAVFRARPNRFIAEITLGGAPVLCHVKNTGRCGELLVPGAEIWVQDFGPDTSRKTRYDLITVRRGDGLLVNLDSQAPNRVFAEYAASSGLFGTVATLRPEVKFGDSRFDFYAEGGGARSFIEVKGVSLEREGAALFPDAPTERGLKHVRELIRCAAEGYRAYMAFIVQFSGAGRFRPNMETQPEFGRALSDARDAGVHLVAVECAVTPGSLTCRGPIEVEL